MIDGVCFLVGKLRSSQQPAQQRQQPFSGHSKRPFQAVNRENSISAHIRHVSPALWCRRFRPVSHLSLPSNNATPAMKAAAPMTAPKATRLQNSIAGFVPTRTNSLFNV